MLTVIANLIIIWTSDVSIHGQSETGTIFFFPFNLSGWSMTILKDAFLIPISLTPNFRVGFYCKRNLSAKTMRREVGVKG